MRRIDQVSPIVIEDLRWRLVQLLGVSPNAVRWSIGGVSGQRTRDYVDIHGLTLEEAAKLVKLLPLRGAAKTQKEP